LPALPHFLLPFFPFFFPQTPTFHTWDTVIPKKTPLYCCALVFFYFLLIYLPSFITFPFRPNLKFVPVRSALRLSLRCSSPSDQPPFPPKNSFCFPPPPFLVSSLFLFCVLCCPIFFPFPRPPETLRSCRVTVYYVIPGPFFFFPITFFGCCLPAWEANGHPFPFHLLTLFFSPTSLYAWFFSPTFSKPFQDNVVLLPHFPRYCACRDPKTPSALYLFLTPSTLGYPFRPPRRPVPPPRLFPLSPPAALRLRVGVDFGLGAVAEVFVQSCPPDVLLLPRPSIRSSSGCVDPSRQLFLPLGWFTAEQRCSFPSVFLLATFIIGPFFFLFSTPLWVSPLLPLNRPCCLSFSSPPACGHSTMISV